MRPVRPAPLLGQHTEEVLREVLVSAMGRSPI
jgi:crotonobetainyl-CoA:carnitine CoA-transferase CaiB-like acyl-CoA transferase